MSRGHPGCLLPEDHQALLLRLPAEERAVLVARCDAVELLTGECLATADQPLRYAYFPLDAVCSLLSTSSLIGPEVALVGNEGVVGATLVLGVAAAPFTAVVSLGGRALRISAPRLWRELAASARFAQVVRQYLWVLATDLGQGSACAGKHSVEQRLARWLLMASERKRSPALAVTHVQLARLLGVRRAGITDALHHLQALQAVVQRRGGVQVMEAAALGQAACACHARMDARYERIFAHTSPPSDRLSSFIFHNIEDFIR
jgi:CRP-like cAMP-binding protein